MKTAIIIQARMASQRLPNKALATLHENLSVLAVLLHRAKQAKTIEQLIVATTTNLEDDAIAQEAAREGVLVFRGPDQDVLRRFFLCAQEHRLDYIVRLTGDCPLVMPDVIDALVTKLRSTFWDYAETHESYPEGLDIHAFTMQTLRLAQRGARTDHDREHVVLWMRRDPSIISVYQHKHVPYAGHVRVTIDVEDDLEVVREVVKRLGPDVTLTELLHLYANEPDIWAKTRAIERNASWATA